MLLVSAESSYIPGNDYQSYLLEIVEQNVDGLYRQLCPICGRQIFDIPEPSLYDRSS